MKVLLCTQDPRLLKGVPKVSTPEPPEFVIVREISELVSRVYDEMPHIVVADVRQSDAGALDTLSQMQKDVILGYIPLVLLTDSAKRGQRIDCGADLYLEKPVQWKELWYHITRIVSESQHDLDVNPLTNLPGNRSTVWRLEDALRDKKGFAVSYIDLAGLNHYNAAYGVNRGDFLIRETSLIIQEAVKRKMKKDTFVGHLGGDDFVVISSPDKAVAIAERIIEHFDESIHRFYGKLDRQRGYMALKDERGEYRSHPFVTMSIAIIDNEHVTYRHIAEVSKSATEIHNYLKQFPVSSYLKDRRKELREPLAGISAIGVSGTNSVLKRRSGEAWENHHERILRVSRVLERRDVRTVFQSISDVQTQEAVGYEALSRFRSENTGGVDPTQMFQDAREVNLIKPLDVLCAQKALENAGQIPHPVKLFININRETLMDRDCVEMIFKNASFPPDRVVLELTEQSLLPATAKIAEAMEVLRKRGIQLAIDDIGGGSVSLRDVAYLKPEYMKFDRTLIRGIDNDHVKQKILVSLIVFANGIKAKTAAEGIETPGEFHWIKGSAIDYAQGFYLGRPSKILLKKTGSKGKSRLA